MKLEEVNARLQELGWKPDPGVKLTLLEKKSALRELLEQSQDPGHRQKGYRSLAKMTKEELRQICMELQIHLTGNETKPQLTCKIKEKQAPPPEVLADDTLADFGKYRGRTYEWFWSHDPSYCLWVTDTVVEEGDKCSPSLKRLAEYIENRRQMQTRAASEGPSASNSAATASSPATLSAPRDTEEDPKVEIEKLRQQIDELKSQISSQRRKTVARDADMQNTES